MGYIIQNICKADPIGENEEVPNCEIHITKSLPKLKLIGEHVLHDVQAVYELEAKRLMTVLKKCLPQGTRHQLLIELLKDNVNLYRGI
jgi:hypothetical protein